ncbi:11019_t:CDS:2 [Acaulospora colombiana]|uniref:11019_t:CDS:1 n=1 Tax=Acaulospora colombiana TaxID=27376 RepID=A0ACA9MRS3_9GLOM|nr:11019_t:CDS:2 [Acaulospora colombiana]
MTATPIIEFAQFMGTADYLPTTLTIIFALNCSSGDETGRRAHAHVFFSSSQNPDKANATWLHLIPAVSYTPFAPCIISSPTTSHGEPASADPQSLNGGDFRGISQLYIIADLMHRIHQIQRTKRPNPRDEDAQASELRPCECFVGTIFPMFEDPVRGFDGDIDQDIIAGTGIGGLNAILLGRLGLTVDQSIEILERLQHEVLIAQMPFPTLASLGKAGSNELEQFAKRIVKDATGDPDTMMKREKPGCHSFVTAKHDTSSRSSVILSSYRLRTITDIDCTIWQAIRATLAVPEIFDPIRIGQYDDTPSLTYL